MKTSLKWTSLSVSNSLTKKVKFKCCIAMHWLQIFDLWGMHLWICTAYLKNPNRFLRGSIERSIIFQKTYSVTIVCDNTLFFSDQFFMRWQPQICGGSSSLSFHSKEDFCSFLSDSFSRLRSQADTHESSRVLFLPFSSSLFHSGSTFFKYVGV